MNKLTNYNETLLNTTSDSRSILRFLYAGGSHGLDRLPREEVRRQHERRHGNIERPEEDEGVRHQTQVPERRFALW